MSTPEYVVGVLLGVAASGGWAVAFGLYRSLVDARKDRRAALEACAIALDKQIPSKATTPWKAMPGNRLELGSSGFYIELNLQPGIPLYILRTPEHLVFGYGAELSGLKTLAERLAAERAEFEPGAPLPLGQMGHA